MNKERQNRNKSISVANTLSRSRKILQRKCACGGSAAGECEECKKRELQRKSAGAAGPAVAPAIVHEVLSSPGQPLDTQARSFFEPRFDYDFSKVRVHTDEKAAKSARNVNALAYTVGQDVVFGRGQYSPDSNDGKRLIAHELTHTIQQSRGTLFGTLGLADSGLEWEADTVSRAALAGENVAVTSSAGLGLSRQPMTGKPANPAAAASPAPATTDPNTIDEFDTGSAKISDANNDKLKQIASRILESIKQTPSLAVQVVGHTDAQGFEGENKALGLRRAVSARDALIKMGVPAKNLSITSKGQTEPVDSSEEKDNPRNRRVEVKFAGSATPAGPASPKKAPVPLEPKKAPVPQEYDPTEPVPMPSVNPFAKIPIDPGGPAPTKPPAPKPPGEPLPGPRERPGFRAPDPPVVPPIPKGAEPKTPMEEIQNALAKVLKAIDRALDPILSKLPQPIANAVRDKIHDAIKARSLEPLRQFLKTTTLAPGDQKTILDAVQQTIFPSGGGQ